MFRVLGAFAAAFALISAAPVATASPRLATANNGLPPERFRGNTSAVVIFTDKAGVGEICGTVPPPQQIIACAFRTKTGTPVIVMPNACKIGEVELYARIMCHEAGHIQGWTGDHEE